MSVLELTVSRSGYGAAPVLRDLGVVVEDGELVAVLGANGAGKTTLLRTISGVMVKSSAEVLFEGRDVSKVPAYARSRAGIIHVPEGRHIFPDLTISENLVMGAYATRDRDQKYGEELDRVYDLFPVLSERVSERAMSLSGGEQQMLAIGRGLMGAPRLLLVDEASLGLAPLLAQGVFDALDQIRGQGTAVLMVEQNARGALGVADRAYVLEGGTVALAGTASELGKDGRIADLYLGGHGSKR